MTDDFELLHTQVLLAVLLGLLVIERLGALQARAPASVSRWWVNVSLPVLGAGLLGLLFPATLVALAADAQGSDARWLQQMPWLLSWPLGFLLMDLLAYVKHRLSHRLEPLWRVHRVHHSDIEVDVTTALRHHPVEAVLGTVFSAALVVGVGLPWPAVAAYLLVSGVVAALSHANLRWPRRLEALLARVIVTPGVHLLHHSSLPRQTDSNFGTVFTLWDRLFGTFSDPLRQRPRALGLEGFRRPEDDSLASVLWRQPLAGSAQSRAAADATPRAPFAMRPLAPPIGRAWRRAWVQLGIGSAVLLFAMAGTLQGMVDQWAGAEAYRYAWLVLPVMAYAVGWHWRSEWVADRPQPTWWGVAWCGLAGVAWGLADLMNVEVGRQLALVGALMALVLATVGFGLFRRWLAVIGLLVFLVPSGDVLQPVLRWITAQGLALSLPLLGLPVEIKGFWITNGGLRYFVADACAGLPYVTLLGFLGYALGTLVDATLRRALTLMALGAVLGIVANLLRAIAIVVLDHFNGSQMDLAGHGHWQWLTLLVALVVLLLVLAWTMPATAPAFRPRSPRPAARPDHWPVPSAVAPMAAALLSVAVVGAVTLTAPPAMSGAHPAAVHLPVRLAGWSLVDPQSPLPVGGEAVAAAGRYTGADRSVRIDVIRSVGRHHKLSEHEMAPRGPVAWRDIQRGTSAVCHEGTCADVLHTVWRAGPADPLRHTYAVFVAGDVVTTSRLRHRAAAAWARVAGHPVRPHLVGLTVDGAALPPPQVLDLLQAVTRQL